MRNVFCVLARAIPAGTAAIALSSCGLQAAPVQQHPASSQASPEPQQVAAVAPAPQEPAPITGAERETFCQEMVQQRAERDQLDNQSSNEPEQPSSEVTSDDTEESYEPRALPDLMFLRGVDEAPRGRTVALLGRPCLGNRDIWVLSVLQEPESEQAGPPRPVLIAAFPGSQFTLPDGRAVFLAPASSGDFHAALGSFVSAILNNEGHPTSALFLMPGGGTFGSAGNLSVPIHQPLGAFHVWQEGGGTWQGYTQAWAGVTDFSGSIPRSVGTFLTSADFPCHQILAASDQHNAICRGGKDYNLSSITYSPSGPDELKLTWRMTEFDEDDRGARRNVTQHNLNATYALRGEMYRLVHGEEPPHV